MPDVTIPAGGGSLPAYVAAPTGSGPWPGVVVVHDVFGMSADVRRQTDWMASEGFVAVAPDLMSHGAKATCTVALFRELRARRGRGFDEVEVARSWLASDERCSGRVGVIGFCLGGGFALLLAAGHGFGAASVNYGEVPKDAADLLRGACPVVGSFGGRDRTLRGAADHLRAACSAAGVTHDVVEYPDAGHAFLNEHDSALSTVARVLMPGGFHPAAAADARRRIAAFFDTHLGMPPSTDGAAGPADANGSGGAGGDAGAPGDPPSRT